MASPSPVISPPLVLSFAHSDPTGGGGLQADLLTLASLGTHGLSVTTAITVQDTAGATDVLALDADWVEDQARTLLEDVRVAAFKVGMLASFEQVTAVAGILSDYAEVPIVLYPGLTRLLADEAREDEVFAALRDLLLPQATLLIVDVNEATLLIGDDDEEDHEDVAGALAERILATGCAAVLLIGIDGGRGEHSSQLFADDGVHFTQRWEASPEAIHGAGETLSAALAACIAGGDGLADAARNAQGFTVRALAAGYRPGMGRLLPDRLFWARGELAAGAGRVV